MIRFADIDPRPRRAADSSYGIGIVGCGGIVNYAHLPAYRASDLRVIGCYDRDGEAASATAARHELPRVYDSLDALLADDAVQIVDIAVPAAQQRGIAERALAAGKHLLCQKPLAEELVDARAIIAAARAAGKCAAVNQQMRWSAGIAAAKQLIAGGAIGRPTDAQILVSTATPWHLWPWLRVAPRLDVMYHSIHYIDSMRYLFGDPAWVTASHTRYPEQPEIAETKTVAVLDYDDGLQALIAVNHHDHSGDPSATFRFLGTDGAIDGTIGLLYNYPDGRADTVRYKAHAAQVWEERALETLWIPDAFLGPMASLMEAIAGDDPPITDVAENLGTLQCVHAAYIAAAERRSVSPASL